MQTSSTPRQSRPLDWNDYPSFAPDILAGAVIRVRDKLRIWNNPREAEVVARAALAALKQVDPAITGLPAERQKAVLFKYLRVAIERAVRAERRRIRESQPTAGGRNA